MPMLTMLTGTPLKRPVMVRKPRSVDSLKMFPDLASDAEYPSSSVEMASARDGEPTVIYGKPQRVSIVDSLMRSKDSCVESTDNAVGHLAETQSEVIDPAIRCPREIFTCHKRASVSPDNVEYTNLFTNLHP